MVEIADDRKTVIRLGLAKEKQDCFSRMIRDSESYRQDDEFQEEYRTRLRIKHELETGCGETRIKYKGEQLVLLYGRQIFAGCNRKKS